MYVINSCRFIRLAPFNDYTVWKEMVQKTGNVKCFSVMSFYDIVGVGMQRLQTLMQSLLLRRTKQEIGHDGKPLVSLGIM